jgi:hypothetical protein
MSSGAGRLDGSVYPFKDRRHRDRVETRTGKDDRCARHTSVETTRRALINPAANRRQTLLRINSVFCDKQCFFLHATVPGCRDSCELPWPATVIPACCSAQLHVLWFAFLVSCSARRVSRAALILQSAVVNYIITGAYAVHGVCCCHGQSSPCACCVGTLCECAVSAIKELERRLIASDGVGCQ